MLLTMNETRDGSDHQYGRRIEADRSWTVYHVFSGIPADADAGATTGLNHAEATDMMISLNRRDDGRESGCSAPKRVASFTSTVTII